MGLPSTARGRSNELAVNRSKSNHSRFGSVLPYSLIRCFQKKWQNKWKTLCATLPIPDQGIEGRCICRLSRDPAWGTEMKGPLAK